MINTPESHTFDVIKHDLSKYLPIRVVLDLRNAPTEVLAQTEESFNMNTSKTHARIYWSGTAYSILGTLTISGIDDANYNATSGYTVVDPFAEDCPITVDWQAWKSATTKYHKRNAPFAVRQIQ